MLKQAGKAANKVGSFFKGAFKKIEQTFDKREEYYDEEEIDDHREAQVNVEKKQQNSRN